MEVEFDDVALDALENDATAGAAYDRAIVRGFRKVMQAIRAAVDERDLYKLKSLHFEKLQGKRQHQHSLRLNDRWRLIVELRGKAPDKRIGIVEIADYH
jgi:toxin HigB-1